MSDGATPGWRCHTDPTQGPIHIWPENDLIEHNTTTDYCVCGPKHERVEREDGSDGWLVIHHSLDGREQWDRSGEYIK